MRARPRWWCGRRSSGSSSVSPGGAAGDGHGGGLVVRQLHRHRHAAVLPVAVTASNLSETALDIKLWWGLLRARMDLPLSDADLDLLLIAKHRHTIAGSLALSGGVVADRKAASTRDEIHVAGATGSDLDFNGGGSLGELKVELDVTSSGGLEGDGRGSLQRRHGERCDRRGGAERRDLLSRGPNNALQARVIGQLARDGLNTARDGAPDLQSERGLSIAGMYIQ